MLVTPVEWSLGASLPEGLGVCSQDAAYGGLVRVDFVNALTRLASSNGYGYLDRCTRRVRTFSS